MLRNPWCETGACLIFIQKKKMQNRYPFQSAGKISVLKRLIKLTLKYSLIIRIQLKGFIMAVLQTLRCLSPYPLTSPIPAPWLEYFPQGSQSAFTSHICHGLTFPTSPLRIFLPLMICSSFKICKHISLYAYTKIKIQELHVKENMEYSFQVWITSFDMMTSIHFVANSWFHFSLRLKKIAFCICVIFFSFIYWWTSWPVHSLASWQCCSSKQKPKHLMVGSRELWVYAKDGSYPSSYS